MKQTLKLQFNVGILTILEQSFQHRESSAFYLYTSILANVLMLIGKGRSISQEGSVRYRHVPSTCRLHASQKQHSRIVKGLGMGEKMSEPPHSS